MSEVKIFNEDLSIEFTWDISAMEMDLLSLLLHKNKEKISEDDVVGLLAGTLDSLIMLNIKDKSAREVAVFEQRRLGKSEDYINRYLKGWDSVVEIHK